MNVAIDRAGFQCPMRRVLLKGALAAPLATTLAAPATAAQDTPILRLFREWEANLDAGKAACEGMTDQDFEREDEVYAVLDPQRHAIERAIAAEPATNLADLAAKVIVLSGEGCWGLPDATVMECARIAGRDFAELPRCLFNDPQEFA